MKFTQKIEQKERQTKEEYVNMYYFGKIINKSFIEIQQLWVNLTKDKFHSDHRLVASEQNIGNVERTEYID